VIYIIKSGHIVSPVNHIDGIYDIKIEDAKITAVEKNMDISDEKSFDDIIYADGLTIFPGLVDCHCHLRVPGFEYKEDLETGTRSAAKGGFTSVACMPNTDPVADNSAVIEYIINKAKEDACVNVFPIGAITKGLEGKELSEIGELKFSGAVAISDDGNPVRNPDIMMKALQYASMFDISVISHCEEKSLSEGYMNDGYVSTVTGLKGIPSASEEIMAARDLILSQYLDLPVHITHVSSALTVQLIREAKKRGVRVTCDTCPHYFALTEEALIDYDTNAKVSPPLKTEKDRIAVIEGIKDGTVDIIATDHAPHHKDEKNVEFQQASNGMVGFETAVPLVIEILHHQNKIPLIRIAELMSKNPSALLSLNKGIIDVGSAADLTAVDIGRKETVNVGRFESKSKNSPFNGYVLRGSVRHTIVNGKMIIRDGMFV
jgi:dihydroorotase